MESDRNAVLKHAFDRELMSLGSSIYQTIMWHMDGRGVFSNPRAIDINSLYLNLQEIMGPHADMIMDMTWEDLEKNHGAKDSEKSRKSFDKIRRWIDAQRAAGEGGA
ncbi:MAG TPA: hypothetical protein VHA09_05060 [Nitrososphaera sp.]|nr:hypothetical protein [Nitrososphaera sp.]